MTQELQAAIQNFREAIDKTAGVASIRGKGGFNLTIDKAETYSEPRDMGSGETDYNFLLLGSVKHDPSFGFPIKFKAHVQVTRKGSKASLSVIHTDRSGKVTPKIMSDYVKLLLDQHKDSWLNKLPY